MLDKFGQQLKLGDKINIQAQVVALYPAEPNHQPKSPPSRTARDQRSPRLPRLPLHPLENRDMEEPMNPALSYIYARLSEPSTW